jgi:proteasome assembly chaperone (PAC2) family protein
MICAFQGWNDAGDAASTAAAFMCESLAARRFAQVDTEEFYDFQANRPRILVGEDNERELEWPCVEMFEAVIPRAPRDLVFVHGVEPSLRWRAFSLLIVELAEALGVQMVITLGSLLADVPHTRPVAMTGFASDPKLMERMNAQHPGSYEGPTGIVGVLHTISSEAGLPSMSLWASIPHYVAAAPSPKATLALVRRLRTRAGLRHVRASGGYRRLQRPRRAGLRRTPGARRRRRGGADRTRGSALRGSARARLPALPAPARTGRAQERALTAHSRSGPRRVEVSLS